MGKRVEQTCLSAVSVGLADRHVCPTADAAIAIIAERSKKCQRSYITRSKCPNLLQRGADMPSPPRRRHVEFVFNVLTRRRGGRACHPQKNPLINAIASGNRQSTVRAADCCQ